MNAADRLHSSTPFFLELIQSTDEARRSFEANESVIELVANGLPVDRYRQFLLELYHVVYHFNPTCAAAASRMEDPRIRYFLYEHMMEEKGHEEWVIQDLSFVGVPREQVLSYRPSFAVRTLNGYNYWVADRRNPCGVLGMLYALEVIASVYGGPVASAMTDALLLQDERGISFISSHATMDAEHMAELRPILDLVEGSEARLEILESVETNFERFTRVIEGV